MRRPLRLLLAFAVLLSLCLPGLAERRADHVFIVSLDGGKPAVIRESKMPELNHLVKHGAHTWEAQTVFPSITLVSHTSMLTGVGPEKHHVTWNDWVPARGMISAPTIFALAKKQGLTTAMFVNKPKFIHLFLPGTLNEFSLPCGDAKGVAEVAARYIRNAKPNLCFIHFADPDSKGHAFGWGSAEQIRAFADCDRALKALVDSIKKAGIADTSVLIVTADHGGHERTHGSRMPEDMNIPWIAWGRGVRRGFPITSAVTTYDTAATALWLLDVPLPADFDGKPVTSAFSETAGKP